MYFPKAISLMFEILVNRLLKSSMFLISKLYFHRYHCWRFYNTKFCVEVTMCMFLFIIQLWNKSEAIFIWHFCTKKKKKKFLNYFYYDTAYVCPTSIELRYFIRVIKYGVQEEDILLISGKILINSETSPEFITVSKFWIRSFCKQKKMQGIRNLTHVYNILKIISIKWIFILKS